MYFYLLSLISLIFEEVIFVFIFLEIGFLLMFNCLKSFLNLLVVCDSLWWEGEPCGHPCECVFGVSFGKSWEV